MKKKIQAFTLIELLVVVAIIAILAAVLFPAITGAMENTRARDDAAKLKQLGLGIRNYLNDSKESFFSREAAGDSTWTKILRKQYVQDWRGFRSPFDIVNSNRPNRDEDPVPVSYGLNEKMFDTFVGKWNAPQSGLIMAAPALDLNVSGKRPAFRQDAVSTAQVSITAPSGSSDLGTHGNRTRVNVLYADGSAVDIEWKQFSDASSQKGQRRWDPAFDE